ncbi:hypothetical protein [Aeromicrobium sp. UC242_57]|uniref:hypothetical protein n=1 Tax=Aeromicrobium sp. UC242_57 TaxID=3374624 RepID=UPI0037B32081
MTKNVPTTPPAVTSTSLRRPPVLQSLVVLTFAVLLVLAFVLDRGVVVIGVLALLGTASGFDPTRQRARRGRTDSPECQMVRAPRARSRCTSTGPSASSPPRSQPC